MDNSTRRTLAVITEIIAGAFLGVIVAYLVGIALGGNVPAPSEGFGDIVLVLVAVAIVYPIAVAAGVWLTGKRVYQRPGSYWMALLGAFGGVLITVILAPMGVATIPALLQGLFIALPPILSALAFTRSASRREKGAA